MQINRCPKATEILTEKEKEQADIVLLSIILVSNYTKQANKREKRSSENPLNVYLMISRLLRATQEKHENKNSSIFSINLSGLI